MRKGVVVVVVLVSGALLAPVTAHARHLTGATNCQYVDSEMNVRILSDTAVYVGSGGTTDDATVVGACMNEQTSTGFDGGTVECGVADDADTDEILDAVPAVGTDAYCVVDGDDDNAPQALAGYVGLSSYEDDADEPARTVNGDCDGNGGSNGGSCLGTPQGISVNQPPITFGIAPFGCQTDDFDTDDGTICEDPNHDGDEIEVGHPTPICGSTSGPHWENSTRDGCSVP